MLASIVRPDSLAKTWTAEHRAAPSLWPVAAARTSFSQERMSLMMEMCWPQWRSKGSRRTRSGAAMASDMVNSMREARSLFVGVKIKFVNE